MGKSSAKARTRAAIDAKNFPFKEILEAKVLGPQELRLVERFVSCIRRKNVLEVAEMATKDFEGAMRTIAEGAKVAWNRIVKRTHLHTALMYSMFKHLVPCVDNKFEDLASMLAEFPEFETRDEEEQWELLKFANAVHLMVQFMPPESNKQVYMEVASRLASDFSRRFVTGGGQTPETGDRVLIYERVGNVTKRKRTRRKPLECVGPTGRDGHRKTRSGQIPPTSATLNRVRRRELTDNLTAAIELRRSSRVRAISPTQAPVVQAAPMAKRQKTQADWESEDFEGHAEEEDTDNFEHEIALLESNGLQLAGVEPQQELKKFDDVMPWEKLFFTATAAVESTSTVSPATTMEQGDIDFMITPPQELFLAALPRSNNVIHIDFDDLGSSTFIDSTPLVDPFSDLDLFDF